MNEAYAVRLRAHVEPANTRQLLTLAGLYLVAFELVSSTIIDDVKSFLCSRWDKEGKPLEDADYRRNVLAGGTLRPLEGSLNWLVEAGALTKEQAATVRNLRRARNRVAHEIPAMVADPDFDIDMQPLIDTVVVLKRLAVYFGAINVDTNPDFDHEDVDYEGIESGLSLLYRHVLDAFYSATGGGGAGRGHETQRA